VEVLNGGMLKAKRGRPSSDPPEERLNGESHFIERKKRCLLPVLCAKKFQQEKIYYCKTCSKKPFLHSDKCFELCHMLKSF
jgi:hypothetical protein